MMPARAVTKSSAGSEFRRSSGDQFLQHCGHRGEELVDLRRVLAAGFGEVRTAAAAAPDDRRQLADDLAGLDSPGQVLADRDDDRDLAVARRSEDDHAAAEAIAERVRQPAEGAFLEAVRASCVDLDPRYLADAVRQ